VGVSLPRRIRLRVQTSASGKRDWKDRDNRKSTLTRAESGEGGHGGVPHLDSQPATPNHRPGGPKRTARGPARRVCYCVCLESRMQTCRDNGGVAGPGNWGKTRGIPLTGVAPACLLRRAIKHKRTPSEKSDADGLVNMNVPKLVGVNRPFAPPSSPSPQHSRRRYGALSRARGTVVV